MNKKEIAEIKRRMDAEKGNISCIRGCYVSQKGEVLSVFNDSVITLPPEEAQRYMTLFKRVLSGAPGQTQLDVVFTPEQVSSGEEHRLLMDMRDCALKDDAVVNQFYQAVIDALKLEDNYLILLTHDTYDVPHRSRDAMRSSGDSETVFPYFICCICPVKLSKPALSYVAPDSAFRSNEPDWVVGAPELGFMFPSFDDRASNIYNAVYYVRDAAEPHEELTDALFRAEMPISAPEQKQTFETILQDSLAEELSLEVVQAVHEQLSEKIKLTAADKEADAPVVSEPEVRSILETCGVAPERVQAFEDKYEEQFGRGTNLSAASIVNPKQFEVRTPSVVIHVSPEFSDMIETRVIDGKRYIMIRAEENVEVNGVNVNIHEDGKDEDEETEQ